MFDFLKKKLNKTIKDASETTEEEMTQHDKEFAKDLDSLEEAFSSIEDKYSKDSSDEDTTEDTKEDEDTSSQDTTDEDKSEAVDDALGVEESSDEEDLDDESVEETDSVDEDEATEEDETIEEDEKDDQEDTLKDSQEESKEDSSKKTSEGTDKVDQEEDKKENKGRFSFFRRNKKEDDSDKKEEAESDKEADESVKEDTKKEEEKEDTAPDVSAEESPDEDKEESVADEDEKEENKGRFSFFRRNKKDKKEEDESDKKAEEEKEETTSDEAKKDVKEAPKESKKDKEESGGMFSFITKKTIKEEDIEEILDELFMSLLEGDVAYEVADKIVESVKEDLVGKKIQRRGDMELFTTNALKNAITEIIDNGSVDLLANIEESKQNGEPYKIMFVGINGTGKTTTIAKMATYLEKHGYSSVFGASDTFRAGAIEQLEHHAKNLNLKIIKHERNSDPAAVAFDAVEHARATGKDVVLIDTSGRMQTNANLMDEMKKIKRVSKPDFVMYVGDALMGNDATEQASKFNEVIDIDGIILTKADADAKGGAALSIGHVIHKPILFIGTGQSYDDLMEFKPEWMINLIFEE